MAGRRPAAGLAVQPRGHLFAVDRPAHRTERGAEARVSDVVPRPGGVAPAGGQGRERTLGTHAASDPGPPRPASATAQTPGRRALPQDLCAAGGRTAAPACRDGESRHERYGVVLQGVVCGDALPHQGPGRPPGRGRHHRPRFARHRRTGGHARQGRTRRDRPVQGQRVDIPASHAGVLVRGEGGVFPTDGNRIRRAAITRVCI